jgi:hypothetical protein
MMSNFDLVCRACSAPIIEYGAGAPSQADVRAEAARIGAEVPLEEDGVIVPYILEQIGGRGSRVIGATCWKCWAKTKKPREWICIRKITRIKKAA